MTLTQRHIDELWFAMIKMFGSRWTREYGDVDDGSWLKALNGLTPEQLVTGTKRCIDSGREWPPSLPKFVSMCYPDPEDIGLPSVKEAFGEALRQSRENYPRYSHSAVYHAYIQSNTWNINSKENAFEVFEKTYLKLVRRVSQGEELSPVPTLIPSMTAHVKTKYGHEQSRKLKTMLKVKVTQ